MFSIFGIPAPLSVRAAAARADQRRLLRAAVARARGDLRDAEHHQFRPWRAVHDGRLRGLDGAELSRHRLLVGADRLAAGDRRVRAAAGTHHHPPALRARSALRPAAHLRARARHRGAVPQRVRLVGPALQHPARARRAPPISASCPCRTIAAGSWSRRSSCAWRPGSSSRRRRSARRCGRPPRTRRWCRLRRQRAAHRVAHLCRRRGARRVRGRARGADLFGEPQHGVELHHHRVRRGGDRRHGLDPRLDRLGLRARRGRGADEGVLSRRLPRPWSSSSWSIVLLWRPQGLFGRAA